MRDLIAGFAMVPSLSRRRVVVVGMGVSATQLLAEISTVAADTLWVTRREPHWIDDPAPGRLAEAVQGADLVITGEGALDEQTLQGKGPAEVARRAAARRMDPTGTSG